MKRILILLACGLFGFAFVSTGSAQAAPWQSCGPVPVPEGSTTHVWVLKGECGRATAVIRGVYMFEEELPDDWPTDGSGSGGFGQFDCLNTSKKSFPIMRCEKSPTVILGLGRAGSNPNEWRTPPAVTPTLTRKEAIRSMKSNLITDDARGSLGSINVECPKRLSRLSFKCRYEWSGRRLYFRGSGQVTKSLHSLSGSFSTRAFDRECLKVGGRLKACEF